LSASTYQILAIRTTLVPVSRHVSSK